MNHPSSEEWVALLYGEVTKPVKDTLNEHLRNCPECRKKMGVWRQTRRSLDQWKIPIQHRSVTKVLSWSVKWAAAAALVLGVGFALGRHSSPRMDSETIAALQQPLKEAILRNVKSDLENQFVADWVAVLSDKPELLNSEFRKSLRAGLDQWAMKAAGPSIAENQRLLASFAETYEANRATDQRTVVAWLKQAEQRRNSDYSRLRRALETVAVSAADQFQRTATELGQLANYTQPRNFSDPSSEESESINVPNRKAN